jgi:hypothetical protein
MVVLKLSWRPQIQHNEMEIAMKQHDITKLCADSLRSYTNDKYGMKLKASHAHEIVAAGFSYQSRAALLADMKYPLSNLQGAEFILLDSSLPLVNSRIQELHLNLPDASILAEWLYSPLLTQKRLSEKVWPTFRDLAVHLVEQRLQEWSRMWRMSPPFEWDMDVDVEHKPDGVMLTVDVGHLTEKGERLRDRKFIINLPRVAANIGYGTPSITETRYSGQFHDPNFNPDFTMHGIA